MNSPPIPAQPSREDRLHLGGQRDNRSPFQRDRDRILYTSAFRRLAGVTQVFSADEGHVFHNRLTHSLEVAQVARRIAERLLGDGCDEAEKLGGLDPDVVEAAALAHDLGHPPFGHTAEEELDELVRQAGIPDGFEGNPQSFRIVTKLALRSPYHEGLDLTRATLNAILKYPWFREGTGTRYRKRGAYRSEQTEFGFARALVPPGDERKSLEAEIMDWADDVTYAVHDVADFFRAGLVPLDRLCSDNDDSERRRFFDGVFARHRQPEDSLGHPRAELEQAFEDLVAFIPVDEIHLGTKKHRAALRSTTAGLIATYVRAVQLDASAIEGGSRLRIEPAKHKKEVIMLKELTWHYVILNPSLASKQFGQRRIIRDLFNIFHSAARSPKDQTVFPFAYRELIQAAGGSGAEVTRLVTDMIAGMTEQQAASLHRRVTGTSLGSALDYLG